MILRVLSAASCLCLTAQAPLPPQEVQEIKEAMNRPLDVKVLPPDNVFRFAPQVELPGRPSIALVLSGGGARSMAQIGVIQRMEETGIPVDSITGTSAGSLMGALMASGFSGTDIEDLFTRVDFNRAFLDPLLRSEGATLEEDEAGNGSILSFRKDGGVRSFAMALRDGVEIQRTLEGLMARGAFYSRGGFDGLKYPLRVVATNLETGQGRVFDQGDLVEVLRASMAVPGAFRPVVVEGQPYVDGALVENLPVFIAKEAFHPDFTLAVDVSSPLERRPVSNFFSLAARSLDVVVERRQWESRAEASLLLRPELKGVDFTDYGNQLPAMVAAGRRAFDLAIPQLKTALLDKLVPEELLPVRRVVVNTPRPLPPEAVAMLGRVLPAGRPVHRQDGLVALQQLLMHGWAKEARGVVAEEKGEAVLRLDLVPFPRIQATVLQAPARYYERLQEDFQARFPVGEPFNPEAFGAFLGHWVHTFVMEGTPLVDVRGSRFNEATGALKVVLKEPLISAVTVKGARDEAEARYIKTHMAPLLGEYLRTAQLRQFIGLAEHRLHLQELRYLLKPVASAGGEDSGEDVELILTPVHHQTQTLDLSLGYETTLGGELGFTYRSLNFGGTGVEGEVSGAKDRLQDRAFMALRGPLITSLPGAGMEVWASSYRLHQETPLPYPAPEVLATGPDRRMGNRDLGVGWYARFGNVGQGKARLDATWRQAFFDQADEHMVRHERTAELSTEWDNFDRHTFPREGLMVRGRYGLGESLPGLEPQGDFRFGYLRVRGVTTFGSNSNGANIGLDLDLEYGYGNHLPLDRWWSLGGTSFLMGTNALAYSVPNFLVARLGIPWRIRGPFGSSLMVVPRVDLGVMDDDPAELLRSGRSLGTGLLVRTLFSSFYLELSYGFLRPYTSGAGWGRSTSSFNASIGTQPFDIWKRR
jgi:predicted acylesterase/phospholipase RssA